MTTADQARVLGLPPGPPTPPLHQTARFWRERPAFLAEAFDRYGDVITLRLVPQGPHVLLRDPDHVKEVFRGTPEVFHGGEGNWRLQAIVGRTSLLTIDAPAHRPERKRMMPAFHNERIRGLVDTMRRIAEDEAASWPVGKPIRFLDRSYALTLDIIVRAVLGVTDPAHSAELRDALHKVATIDLAATTMMIKPGLARFWPWRRVVRDRERADRLIFAEIARRRRDPQRDRRADMLSMLVEDTDDDQLVRDEVMNLLMAGHETTAVGLAWLMERLVRHPDVTARLREGLDDPQDPYRTAVFKETLRVRPVIHNVARKLTEDTEIGGWTLPAGTFVAPAIGPIMCDPRVWGADAAEFRPERWLDGSAVQSAWLPFGGGARRCIGAVFAQVEMETVCRALLSTVELDTVAGNDEGNRMHHITMIPTGGARISVARRLATGPRDEAAA